MAYKSKESGKKMDDKYRNPKYVGGKSGSTGSRGNVKICSLTSNDVSYYNKYPVDFKVASQFPWYKIVGDRCNIGDAIYANSASEQHRPDSVLPGLMVVDYIPGPGICNSNNSAPNRAFAQIMADLYAKTTGSNLGFQQADLAMLLTSLSATAALIAEARRVLSSTDFWITKNKWYPRALITALGYDWEDITANKPLYISQLNSLIHMFNNIKTPKFLDVYNRQFALAHNIYVDEDSEFGQIYVFRPKGTYIYRDTQFGCEFVPASSYRGGFANLIAQIRRNLDAWYNSTDLYLINGALLRCYPNTPTVFIDDISMDTLANPTTDKYIMLQLMNANIVDYSKIEQTSLNITQDVENNYLVWEPHSIGFDSEAEAQAQWNVGRANLLRAFDANVTDEDNVEMTRLCIATAARFNADDNKFYLYVTSMGTELVTEVAIYSVALNNASQISRLATFTSNEMFSGRDASTFRSEVAALSPFRYVPCMIVATIDGRCYPFGDIYNYTMVDKSVIDACNTMCALSLWKVDLK